MLRFDHNPKIFLMAAVLYVAVLFACGEFFAVCFAAPLLTHAFLIVVAIAATWFFAKNRGPQDKIVFPLLTDLRSALDKVFGL